MALFKKYLAFFITVLVFPNLTSAQLNVFKEPKETYELSYPAEWKKLTAPANVNLALEAPKTNIKKGAAPVIQVSAIKLSAGYENLSIKELAALEEKMAREQKYDGVTVSYIRSEFKNINNKEWWLFEYTIESAVINTHTAVYKTIHNGVTYAATYNSEIQNYSIFADQLPLMVNNFKFLTEDNSGNKNAPSVNATTNNTKTTPAATGKAGTIAPDAKKMEVDEMRPFFAGHAIVKKGTAQAVINDKGEIVVPYNKVYEGASVKIFAPYFGTLGDYYKDAQPVKMRILVDAATNTGKYLTVAGKMIPALGSIDQEGYDNAEVYPDNNRNTGPRLQSTKYTGEKIISKPAWTRANQQENIKTNFYLTDAEWSNSSTNGNHGWSNGLRPAMLVAFSDTITSAEIERRLKKVGFINRKGEFQVPAEYNRVAEFSEGVAFVAKMDEFGEIRWGAVDNTGKLIIPANFRNQPNRFSSGRAMITAYNQEHVAAAFIDKTGKIIFTLPRNSGDTVMIASRNQFSGGWIDIGPASPEQFLFMEGYTYVAIDLKSKRGNADGYDNFFLLDTNGRYIPIITLMKKHLPGSITVFSGIQDGKFIFKYFANQQETMGMADIEGNIVLPPIFKMLHFFEKESALQYAELSRYDSNGKFTGTKGYIDSEGIFKIVLEQAAAGF